MNWRIKEILNMLEHSGRVTTSSLADSFDVSERTIRNDLNQLRGFMEEHDLTPPEVGASGAVEAGDDIGRALELLDSEDFYSYKLTKMERVQLIGAILIRIDSYITLQKLSTVLCVSRATVIKDLDTVKEQMAEADLAVAAFSNKGLYVQGSEKNKRLFVLSQFTERSESLSDSQYYAFEKQVVDDRQLFTNYDKAVVQKIISEQEESSSARLTDSSFEKLNRCVQIMIQRSRMGHRVETTESGQIDPLAHNIYELSTQYFNLEESAAELAFLNEEIRKLHFKKSASGNKDVVAVQFFARRFIKNVSEDLEIDLNDDFEFYENLSNHLISILDENILYKEENPFVRQIVLENPKVLESVKRHIGDYEQSMNRTLTDVDISYVVIHICAALERKLKGPDSLRVVLVCGGGVGTAQLLQERIKKHYNFNEIEVCSSHGVIEGSGQALVISTVPLNQPGLEYIRVSPFLTDEDYIRIGQRIEALHVRGAGKTAQPQEEGSPGRMMKMIAQAVADMPVDLRTSFLSRTEKAVAQFFNQYEDDRATLPELLPLQRIKLDAECADWQEAVKCSAQALLDDGIITERYVDAMIGEIEKHGPYMVIAEEFALPHSGVGTGSLAPGFSLIRLRNPVIFEGARKVPVRYVCCMSASDKESHLRALFSLGNLLQDPGFRKNLDNAQTPEQIAGLICDYEYIGSEKSQKGKQ